MYNQNDRIYLTSVDITVQRTRLAEMARMPRPAVVAVIRDDRTGYLNAAPYSSGILSLDPLRVVFGVKNWDSKLVFERVSEFVLAIAGRENWEQMWTLAMDAPHGINELEVAGLTELPAKQVDAPFVAEFPINLECRTIKVIPLGGALRNVIVADVIGISIAKDYLIAGRNEALFQAPLHEAVQHFPPSNTYAVCALSGEIEGEFEPVPRYLYPQPENGRYYYGPSEFYRNEYRNALIYATSPRPCYILCSRNADGTWREDTIVGGLIMFNNPAIQVPVRKDSPAHENIRRGGGFTISIPNRKCLDAYIRLRQSPGSAAEAGFTQLLDDMGSYQGLTECSINMECAVYSMEEIPNSEYDLLIGQRTAMNVSGEINRNPDCPTVYANMLYAVLDHGSQEKIAFQDANFLATRERPTSGSRYNPCWWGGNENYQCGFYAWLIEIVQSGYITEAAQRTIHRWLVLWRDEGTMPPEPLKTAVRERLTKALHLMATAHRNEEKWRAVNRYIEENTGFEYSVETGGNP